MVFEQLKQKNLQEMYLKLRVQANQEEYISKYIPDSLKNLPGYSNLIVHNITPIVMERIYKGKDIIDTFQKRMVFLFFICMSR